ncbi:MAG: hypothetical protein IH840_17950, partial [Candidatus Heimdallarchaeota archaeon]|nr:hypothetical protein [Candidatus Heimdallarchaeota archaeon]
MNETRLEILNAIANGEMTIEDGNEKLTKLEDSRVRNFSSGALEGKYLEEIISRITPFVKSEMIMDLQSRGSVTHRELKLIIVDNISPEYL